MDEEFIFKVTEEELAQFPEEGNQSEEEQNQQEYKQGSEKKDKASQESTENQDKEVKIPSLLDLKLPKLYAASRNGRWNKGTGAEKKRRRGSSRIRECQSSPQSRSSPTKQPRWRQPSCHPR